MTTAEKIAFLRGVIAASNITDSQTKRIYEAIADVLDSLAEDVEFNAENIDNIDSRLSEVDEDLDVESLLYTEDLEEMYEDDYAEDEEYSEEEEYPEDEEYDYTEEDYPEDELDLEEEAPETEAEEELPEEEAFEEDELEDEEGEQMYEIECPACHETIYLQESVILEGGVDCPNCGEPLEFDIEFEDE